MKPKGRLLTRDELWELETRYPFSAGNPLCQNAYAVTLPPKPEKTGKRVSSRRKRG